MSAIENLEKTIARLRAPDGCPWDREQTHKSICSCLVEEASEFIDVIERNDSDAHLCEELGDLLLQVVMHAQIASERSAFNLEDVANCVNDKMIRRHPHVFGDAQLKDSAAVLKRWDEIKLNEKNNSTLKRESPCFKNLPKSLSSILKAKEIWKAISKQKLDTGVIVDKESISKKAAVLTKEDAGSQLFELIAACREAGIDSDEALREKIQEVITECEKNLKK